MKYDIHYAIISHKRPENIQKMEEITGIPEKLNWYVGEGEKKDYKHAKGHVAEAGGLISARNQALRMANAEYKNCLMIDDDLLTIKMFGGNGENPLTFQNMAKEMYNVLQSIPLHLAGVSPTANAFYYDVNKPIGTKHFIVASCMMTKYPTELFFDEQFKTKEDYDYTLQHIKKYGGVARINYLAPKFAHYTNKGGVVDVRTPKVEQESIKKLKKKWGNAIRDNPRRENEILLRVK